MIFFFKYEGYKGAVILQETGSTVCLCPPVVQTHFALKAGSHSLHALLSNDCVHKFIENATLQFSDT